MGSDGDCADVNATLDGVTPVMYVAYHGYCSADIDMLRKEGGRTAIHIAALNGYIYSVELLLKLGANTNLADMYGENALAIARAKNHSGMVKLLESAQTPIKSAQTSSDAYLGESNLADFHAVFLRFRSIFAF